jgi:hypothetical protein
VRWDARGTVDAAGVGIANGRSGDLSGGRGHRTRTRIGIGYGYLIRARGD